MGKGRVGRGDSVQWGGGGGVGRAEVWGGCTSRES